MGKYYETSSTFNYAWDQLAKAFWNRYPNPYSTHVLSEDTLYREVRGSQLYSRRLLTKTNRMPKWGERFVRTSNQVSIVEESYVNPKDKTITTYTRNIGFTRIMSVVEKVTYTPDPNNPGQTIAYRAAWIDSNMYGFRRAIESFGIDRFRKNCSQAALGFNYVLSTLYPPKVTTEIFGPNVQTVAVGRFGETTEKMKEKARRAGERAKERAGLSTVYAASTGPGADS